MPERDGGARAGLDAGIDRLLCVAPRASRRPSPRATAASRYATVPSMVRWPSSRKISSAASPVRIAASRSPPFQSARISAARACPRASGSPRRSRCEGRAAVPERCGHVPLVGEERAEVEQGDPGLRLDAGLVEPGQRASSSRRAGRGRRWRPRSRRGAAAPGPRRAGRRAPGRGRARLRPSPRRGRNR